MDLPPFPVDPGTLDLLSLALDPGPEAERTSVADLLELMSQLGGSDTSAVSEVIHTDPRDEDPYESRGDQPDIGVEIHVMRDPQYHEHDVIRALIAEVRRLRIEVEEYDELHIRMADLLSRTADALNGPPPPLTIWSWHDLPEKAQAAVDAARTHD